MHFCQWNGTNLLTEATPICFQTANLSVLRVIPYQTMRQMIWIVLKCPCLVHVWVSNVMFRFNKSQRTLCGVPCNPIQELACRCLSAAQWMNPLMTNLVCLPCLHIQPGIVYLRPLLLLLSLRFCSPKQHFTFIVLLAFFQIFQAGGTVAQFAQRHPIFNPQH